MKDSFRVWAAKHDLKREWADYRFYMSCDINQKHIIEQRLAVRVYLRRVRDRLLEEQ